uniref:kelch-like protein 12 n=1 Tax=Styela clava TaxID=7725 RepID=UPI0019399E81|nr:kelch-like protein 12 [Styela clava]
MAKVSDDEFDLDIDVNEHNALMMGKMHSMKKDGQHSDLVIKVGSEEFLVHKNMMSAGSDYFDAMLSHDNLETNTGIVNMQDVDVESVKVCIDYIYTGKASITLEKSEQILHVATLMQLSVLCENIAEFLKAKLNVKSLLIIKQIASMFEIQTLKTACDDFALTNMGAISQEEYFNELDVEFISFMVGSKSFAYSEDSKLAVLLQWIKADIDQRRKLLVEMINLINLNNVSYRYATFLVENERLCSESPVILKLLFLKMAEKFGVEGASAEIPASASEFNAFAVFDKTSKTINSFYPEKSEWQELKNLHDSMVNSNYTAVMVKDFIYVFMENYSVYRINISEPDSTWNKIADHQCHHGQYLRAAVCDGFIYLCDKETLDEYNISQNMWTVVKSEKITLYNCTLVGLQESLYVIGGFLNGSSSSVSRYSQQSSWSSVKAMNVYRQNPAATVYGNRIFVAGGFEGVYLSSTEFYNPQTDSWTNLSSMTVPRGNFCLYAVENKLFAIGGNREGSKSIEKYNFESSRWEHLMNFPENMDIAPRASLAFKLPP